MHYEFNLVKGTRTPDPLDANPARCFRRVWLELLKASSEAPLRKS
jgi:hypothetical protein